MKKITLAIPTFNRPECLERALESALRQNYANLEVLVSDNHSDGNEVDRVVAKYVSRFDNFQFFKQERNIGAINNFMFLLSKASGEYFIWLADDDEFSDNCLPHLANILDSDESLSCAAPNWFRLDNSLSGVLIPRRNYTEDFWLSRALKFIWSANDAFFYGMFRTEHIRKARVLKFCWPNRDQIQNWAYVYLYDIVLLGKVIVTDDESVRFINHSYIEKSYARSEGGVINFIKYSARRANLYFYYVFKTFTWKPLLISIPVIFWAIAGFLKDILLRIQLKVSITFKKYFLRQRV